MAESMLTNEVTAVPWAADPGAASREAAYEEKHKAAKSRRRASSKAQEPDSFEEQSAGEAPHPSDEMSHQIDSFA